MILKEASYENIKKSNHIDWQETLTQFVEMNVKVVELIDYPHVTANVCVTSASHAIDLYGFSNVTVKQKKSQVYLIRTDK